MSKAIVQCRNGEFAELVAGLKLDSDLHNQNVDSVDPGLPGLKCWVLADRSGGFAVLDGRICHVWSTQRGQGDLLVSAAVKRGGKRLDCFDGYLTTLYGRHGFVVVDRIANWDPEGPDVVEMIRP